MVGHVMSKASYRRTIPLMGERKGRRPESLSAVQDDGLLRCRPYS